jgi:peptidoglycan/xylan/chitin deacetylase (PgdA/CDA1 family)
MRSAISSVGKVLWHMPGRFELTRCAGPSYSLRCVVFHNISDEQSPFTAGIGVTITPNKFEAALRFLTAHYVPVCLQDVLTSCEGRGLPLRAILVTFDDAYASVAEWAAPLCQKFGVPVVFFVNAAFLNNQRLAPDNLVCYVANTMGMETINAAIRAVQGPEAIQAHSLADVFGRFFPASSLVERDAFLDALRQLTGINESAMAKEACLYLTSNQLLDLRSFDFEIGNHTYTHPHCRSLSQSDFASEVDKNKAELESLSGTKIRSFSIPYGSSKDLTQELVQHLERTGHQAVFLSESVSNSRQANRFHLDRISTSAESDDSLFLEIEVLPRLRAIRNRLFGNSVSLHTDRLQPLADRERPINSNVEVRTVDRRQRA